MVYQRKWYVVIVGTEPGVYSSWIEAGPKTKNIPGGAIHQSFLSEVEALRVFQAAKERGEVKAYPDTDSKDRSPGKLKNTPLSPLGEEAALLSTPWNPQEDVKPTARHMSLSSPVHSRVSKLRKTLRDPTASCSISSSPPTNVTQVYAPLYEPEDEPPARLSPHFTFISGSSRAYPIVSEGCSLKSESEKVALQLEVSDLGSPSSAPSPADSHPGAEGHTSRPPRCMPPHPEPSPKSKGVKYRYLADLVDTGSVDSRIWFPESRIFDPDEVKPRPLTRPSSPAEQGSSLVPSHEPEGNDSQLRCQIPLADAPFVRTGRGRHLGLAPSWSLPTLPNQEVEIDRSAFGLRSTQLLESPSRRAGKTKARQMDCSVCIKHPAEHALGYDPSPRNYGGSHVQLVPRGCGYDQSAIIVHCPVNCPHETCGPLAPSISMIGCTRATSRRYADACVSPIITITSRTQDKDSPDEVRSTGRYLDENRPRELAGSMHVSQKGIALENDVRSPIVKGAMIPMSAAEVLFERPSPPLHASDKKVDI